jgi:hypothetical protein
VLGMLAIMRSLLDRAGITSQVTLPRSEEPDVSVRIVHFVQRCVSSSLLRSLPVSIARVLLCVPGRCGGDVTGSAVQGRTAVAAEHPKRR